MSGGQGQWFRHTIRVRYQETDQMGVVYHTNYMNWFEWGRTELIRRMGMAYKKLEDRGLVLPVTHAELTFMKPARYDDTIAIYTRVLEFSGVKLIFANEVRRLAGPGAFCENGADGVFPGDTEPEGELLVTGGTKHMWVNRSWKPVRIDREAPDLYKLIGEA